MAEDEMDLEAAIPSFPARYYGYHQFVKDQKGPVRQRSIRESLCPSIDIAGWSDGNDIYFSRLVPWSSASAQKTAALPKEVQERYITASWPPTAKLGDGPQIFQPGQKRPIYPEVLSISVCLRQIRGRRLRPCLV